MAETTCSIDGCERRLSTRGWCRLHYVRWTRHGDPLTVLQPIRQPPHGLAPAERLTLQTQRTDRGCLEWTGMLDASGYGLIKVGTRRFRTHRLAFQLAHGPIPDGMVICHRCDNRPCCNVKHLFLGTHADNAGDMVQKERQARGIDHAFAKLTDDNVRQIRALYAARRYNQPQLAEMFGITNGQISRIVNRRVWRHI